MRCNRARVLCGVRDELDAPTFRALKTHVRQCPDCASSWIEEDAFRRIVAGRPEPKTSAGLTGALLAIPDRAVGWEALRHSLPPRGPVIALALSVGIGALGLLLFDRGNEIADAPVPQPPPAFEAGPDLQAIAESRATRVPRLSPAFDDLPRRMDVEVVDSPLDSLKTDKAAPVVSGPAPASVTEYEVTEPAPVAVSNDQSEEPEEPEGSPADDATSEPSEEIVDPTSEPTPTALATQAPPAWELTLLAVGGILPIEDGVEVQAEIWALGGEDEQVVDEVKMRFSGGEARLTLRSSLPAPIEISVYDGAGGLAPCPGESRVRLVQAAELAAGPVEVTTLYCYPPRATAAPSATATRAPATASPPPSHTPAPTEPATETPPPSPTPSAPAPEPSPIPELGRQGAVRG